MITVLLTVMGFLMGAAEAETRTLEAADFGLAADGQTDDGPAIARLLEAARAHDGSVLLRFPAARTIRAKTSPTRYLFPLEKISELVVDGGGCLFLLDPNLRFMSLTDSRQVTVRNLKVDFDPLPFVEGVVSDVSREKRFVEVRLRPNQGGVPSGGPAHEDGEQAFFSMLWHEGPYGPVSRHYWTARIERTEAANTIRVYAADEFTGFAHIQPESTQISVPTPGVAHRYGPGPCFRVQDNADVAFEDVELWSAPWFGFNILRNDGEVAFRRVNIRPRPGSSRLMSLWRDGFHVKGNRASLRWQDCVVYGMNDDAFNISTHSSEVVRVSAPDRIVVRQKFPLAYLPWREGAMLAAADEHTGRLCSSHRVVAVEAGPIRTIGGHPAAPAEIALSLDTPAPNLKSGTMVWDPECANPDTLLRHCTIGMSCRLQSPVRLEGCTVTGLLWFYCEHVEGPFPSGVSLKNCTLHRGRGNPDNALIFSGLPQGVSGDGKAAAPPRAIHDVVVENSRIYGGFRLEGVENVRIADNHFLEHDAVITVRENHGLVMHNNRDAQSHLLPEE